MEHQVKSYKRRTKSGKIITVKAHTRKGKDGIVAKSGRGDEFSAIRNKKLQREIREYVAEGCEDYGYPTDKDGLMSWKDTLRTLRHPNEAGVRSNITKKFNIKLDPDKESKRGSKRRKVAYEWIAHEQLKKSMSKSKKYPDGAYSFTLDADMN